jgi:hypothetical protein
LGMREDVARGSALGSQPRPAGMARGPVLVLVVIGSGSCHDRIKRRSSQSQDQSREQRQNLAFQFQPCGSREVASLDDRDPPSDVPRHRWRLFVDDCKRFVASDLAVRAAQLVA